MNKTLTSFERRLAILERAAGGSGDELWLQSLTDEELDAMIETLERLNTGDHGQPNVEGSS